jgi:DNA (cytosine-5)-methyltransferase 1
MKHGSLFSGLGGFDLAAEWMGWENIFHCEWMEFPRKVLDYHFPNADSHIDICKTDFKKYANKIDILTGGFPCQPFSMAGKRKGTDDERYLWGEMLRAIQEIKPTFVIAENVFGITNIDDGLVFEQVCLDLEAQGYEVQPFIIPAAAKNAPHRRDRVWFVATDTDCSTKGSSRKSGSIESNGSNINNESSKWRESTELNIGRDEFLRNATDTHSNGLNERHSNYEKHSSQGGVNAQCDTKQSDVDGDVANTDGERCEWKRKCRIIRKERKDRNKRLGQLGNIEHQWEKFPTQPPICGGDDGLPTELDRITFSKWRRESIKGYGNAIVPQIAFEIFKQLSLLLQHSR